MLSDYELGVLCGKIEVYRSQINQSLLALNQIVDEMSNHLSCTDKLDIQKEEWQILADKGEKINAVKLYRNTYGVLLKEARDVVWDYMGLPHN